MPVIKVLLKPSCLDYKILDSRFEVARLVYNTLLGETQKRLYNYWNQFDFLKARDIFKSESWQKLKNKSKLNKDETEELDKPLILIKNAKTKSKYYIRSNPYGRSNSIEQYAMQKIRDKDGWIAEHLDSVSCQTLAVRAFNAIEKKRENRKIRIKFLRSGKDYIYTIDGKKNSPLKWKDGKLIWGGWPSRAGKTKKLILSPIINLNEDEKYRPILKNDKCIKYVSISRKLIGNTWQYCAIINFDGNPVVKSKHKLGIGKIGMDLGTQTYAFVSDCTAKLGIFCEELKLCEKKIKILQRQIQRQIRINNPNNYESDFKDKNGKWKKGKKETGPLKWFISNRQKKIETKKSDLERKIAEYRRCLHGKLTNELRALGDDVKLEKITYKAWQKMFGKSIGRRAPGMFVDLLKHKFTYTNGNFTEVNTYHAKLSQRCPA